MGDDDEVREFVGRGTQDGVAFAEAPGEPARGRKPGVTERGELFVADAEEVAFDAVVGA
ncbi:hypothetical protein [Salinigranum rubrum]|uniref:hypothetical protein n=1 Tax=Salinigranum rubrum TaxID=755307 RepID=UPI0013A536D4|nr:hypothetical protein [Salinigranum rubrum]